MRRRPALALLAALTLGGAIGPRSAIGQRLVTEPEYARAFAPDSKAPLSPGKAFLYSAVVPGSAQFRAGADRWVAYVLVEAWSWLRFRHERSEGRELERRYKDLAWAVARLGTGPRVDGDWEYYEALGKYASSGGYDVDPARPGIQPETDETTYNGSVWALARAIHFPAGVDSLGEEAPEYRSALEYYRRRAAPDAFAWSWGENPEEWKRYGRLIRRSDEAYRSATRVLGVILANHLASAVDAMISAHVGDPATTAAPLELETLFTMGDGGPIWHATVRVAWPRR
jgi:hypothetical protein